MNSFILKGTREEKDEYINRYVRDNGISQFNIIKFEESLKIAEAREIKKILSSTSFSGERRVILINSDPTQEAQNALLKILEETDELTDFIFSGENELLSTIVSRCNVVVISSKSTAASSISAELIKRLTDFQDREIALAAIEEVFGQRIEDPLGQVIISVRQLIIEKLRKSEIDEFRNLYIFLKTLQKVYPIVIYNNINPRIVVENALLSR